MGQAERVSSKSSGGPEVEQRWVKVSSFDSGGDGTNGRKGHAQEPAGFIVARKKAGAKSCYALLFCGRHTFVSE